MFITITKFILSIRTILSPKTGTSFDQFCMGAPDVEECTHRDRGRIYASRSLHDGPVAALTEWRFLVCGVKELPARDGGVERGVENLGRRLVEKGIHVEVLARGTEKARSTHMGITLMSLPYMQSKYLCYYTYMARAFGVICRTPHQRTVVCVHSPAINGGWVPILKLLGYQVVVHSHGLEWRAEKWPQWFRPLMRFFERVAVKTADVVVCVAKHESQYYKRIRKKHRKSIRLIPNGLPDIPPPDGIDILDQLGLRAGQYLLTVGRLVPQKRFGDLIEAHRLASTNRQLLIIGGPSFSEAYAKELRRLADLSGRVIITGELPHHAVQALLARCYAFLSASAHEGCPNALLEAAACGAALVVSDIVAHREICGGRALMFTVGDVEQLAQIIRQIDVDQAVHDQAKSAAIEITRKWPAWDIVAEAWADILIDLQSERGRNAWL